MIELTTHASERSTYIVHIEFKDEAGNPVVPNTGTLKWTLTDSTGRVVNSRQDVSHTPASSIDIVLKGLDLVVGEPYLGGERRVLVEWEYDSTLGEDLPGTEEIRFIIDNFAALTGVS